MNIVLALAIACLVVAVWADNDKAWKDYKEKHGKIYKNKEHEAKSRMNFEKSHKFIEEHNARQAAGLETYTLAHNTLSDMDDEEYRLTRCGKIRNPIKTLTRSGESVDFDSFVDVRQADTVDYSTDPCMTPVKDQGDCGSCYAFSTVAALEFYNCKKAGIKRTFSEQQLVDCSTGFGNNLCQGGDYTYSYDYLIKNAVGIATDTAYPYTALNGTCKFTTTMQVGNIASFVRSDLEGNEAMLMTKLAEARGPVNVAMDAERPSFKLYESGVYTESQCKLATNHAVLLVGYGTLNGINYWKIKNSWGTTWGLRGYMLLERGVNRCGIATDVAYPKV